MVRRRNNGARKEGERMRKAKCLEGGGERREIGKKELEKKPGEKTSG